MRGNFCIKIVMKNYIIKKFFLCVIFFIAGCGINKLGIPLGKYQNSNNEYIEIIDKEHAFFCLGNYTRPEKKINVKTKIFFEKRNGVINMKPIVTSAEYTYGVGQYDFEWRNNKIYIKNRYSNKCDVLEKSYK